MLIQGEGLYIKKADASDFDLILQVYMQCEDFLSLGPVPTASNEMVVDDLELYKEEGDVFCGIYIDDKMIGIVDIVLDIPWQEKKHCNLLN